MQRFWNFWQTQIRITILLVVAVLLLGVSAIFSIPKESSPEVDIPIVQITTLLIGSSAQDVEELVTDPIEDQLQGLEDVENFTSVSSEGVSSIIIQFKVGVDSDEKLQKTKDAVDTAEADLPEDSNQPIVQKLSFNEVPFMVISLSGQKSLADLKKVADDLGDRIEDISDIDKTETVGAPDEIISVLVTPSSLIENNVDVQGIQQAISQSNISFPVGSVNSGGRIYPLELDTRLKDGADVGNVIVNVNNQSNFFVRDIAAVVNDTAEQSSQTRISNDGSKPYQAVTLMIYKKSGEGSIISLSKEILNILDENNDNLIPDGIKTSIVQNDADLIKSDLSTLVGSGAMTIVIIFVVLLMFLTFSESLLATLVVPISYLAAIFIVSLFGLTINFLTLFALILALGVIVDASIVVSESMNRYIRSGVSVREAAKKTIEEYSAPLISGTLTTVLVFLPMLFTSGTIGEFIKSIPITVSAVLMSSLFVSLAVIPSFARYFIRPQKSENKVGQWLSSVRSKVDDVNNKVKKKYELALEKFVFSTNSFWKKIGSVAGLVLISLLLVVVGLVKVELFPSGNLPYYTITAELPQGSAIEATEQVTTSIENLLLQDDRIELFSTVIGQGGENKTTIQVKVKEDVSSLEMVDEYAKKVAEVVPFNVDTEVKQPDDGPPSGSPVEIRFVGSNLEDVESAARSAYALLKNNEKIINATDGIQESSGKISIEINEIEAKARGVQVSAIATALRSVIVGVESTTIKANGEEKEVRIYTVPEGVLPTGRVGAQKVSIGVLQSLPVRTSSGQIVSLDSVADFYQEEGRVSINHREGERLVTVTADVVEGVNGLEITQEIISSIRETLPETVSIETGGESEDINESFASLGRAMMMGMLAIFALLVFQFQSFKQPLYVLSTIPNALIGVFFGLLITGLPLSFPGFIGVVALAGIVVNNAIILIDSMNSLRKSGMTKEDSIRNAAHNRFQAILLTTATTVLGLIPLAFSDPTWSGLAVSIIFGLTVSSVITLFTLPLLYQKFEK
jgi:HAE1 family hydrophobic/amphiphilic exporter-1